jgi:hypothetical protein
VGWGDTSSSFCGQIPHQEESEISVGILSCAHTSILCVLPVFGPPLVCGLRFFSLCTTSFPRYTARTLSLSSSTAEFCHCKQLRQNSFVAAPSVPRFVLSNDHFPALLCVFSTTDAATVRGRSACLALSGFLCITPVGRALDSVASCHLRAQHRVPQPEQRHVEVMKTLLFSDCTDVNTDTNL